MADSRGFGWQSFRIAILVFVLVVASGVALLHSHKDSAPDCQLCHFRDLPTVHTDTAADVTVCVITDLHWHSDQDTYRLKVLSPTRASRAPPAFVFITV